LHCANPEIYNEVVIHATTEFVEEFVRSINRGGHLRDDGSRLTVSVYSTDAGPRHLALTFVRHYDAYHEGATARDLLQGEVGA